MGTAREARLELSGRNVVVMGLGAHEGGQGVAEFLATHGARVTVTDLRSAEVLAPALDRLAGLPIRYVLGEHREEDFRRAEIVIRNPAVPRDSRYLAVARAAGASIEMEMTLFFRLCPAPIVGITGTKGKTSTSLLCHAMLRHHWPDAVAAGNMGRSAVRQLDALDGDTPVVVELSSWQLEGLGEHRLSPQVAVVTNLSPDHLNRYPTMESYTEAKRAIVSSQRATDTAILNSDDPLVWSFRDATNARVLPFGGSEPAGDGAWLAAGDLVWRVGSTTWRVERDRLGLPGEHNAMNALAAGSAALSVGAPFEAVESALRAFTGARDRFEFVAEVNGVRYVNDTTATAPAAAVAALRAADAPVRLIAGGSEKRTDFADFAREAALRATSIVLLDGDATPRLRSALLQAGLPASALHGPVDSMAAAVRLAAHLAQPGDLVLLSPACASFGMFRNEFHRGEEFRAAVSHLLAPHGVQS